MKVCTKCHKPRRLSEFHHCSQRKSGLQSRCKQCMREKVKAWEAKAYPNKPKRPRNPQAPHIRASKRDYQRAYRAKDPTKYKTHKTLSVKRRRRVFVSLKPCEICGKSKRLDAHHPDYSKPLLIVWLCHKCHMALHLAERGGRRSGSKQSSGELESMGIGARAVSHAFKNVEDPK